MFKIIEVKKNKFYYILEKYFREVFERFFVIGGYLKKRFVLIIFSYIFLNFKEKIFRDYKYINN